MGVSGFAEMVSIELASFAEATARQGESSIHLFNVVTFLTI